ncbi:MAG TPA: FtsX-like permease family protein [Actinomycetes bacterium]|nr:FtsX-like permease family protein [Actinomycetes bacterium]
MHRWWLWVRWSGRDLRRRWVLVVAIAMVIAIGTGAYAAFTGSATWRRVSNDQSFASLNTHDLKVRLSAGTTAAEGALLDRLLSLPSAGSVTAAEERLVLPAQVEVREAGKDLLVTGEVVGTGVPARGEVVDDVFVAAGRAVDAGDTGPVVVLERNFAEYHDLPERGALRVSGGQELRWVGHGQAPEHFILTGEGGTGFFAQSTYAVLFASLRTAQDAAQAPGRVNDLVLTLAGGTDVAAVQQQLESALLTGDEPVSATVTTRDEMPAHRLLYRDIDNDQKVWNVIAGLMLAGAAFAAFNLTGRVVEAQRREIGVGMALGVPRAALAVRPLLLGVQIALLGAVLGVLMGAAIGAALADQFRTLLPLPVWQTDFQVGAFARAAALGFTLPMLAVLWPVWRAVRVEPVEAIRVGHLAGRSRGQGLVPLAGRLRLARSTLRQMPVRNVLRTPRRTLLTSLGVAAAVTCLVAIFGMLDSFARAVDEGEREVTHAAPDRLSVQLTGLQPVDSPAVAAVTGAAGVARADLGLTLPGTARANGAEVDLVLETLGPDAVWTPTVVDGTAAGGPGELVLASKAARDLGLRPGDEVVVSHPQRTGPAGFRTVETTMRLVGVHPHPLRVQAYADSSTAELFGLSGAANVVRVVPATGVAALDLQRELFASPLVASAQPVTVVTDALRDALDQYTAILAVAAGITLLLALLIAFNASSISVDERVRDNATMLAFGVPVRGLLGIQTAESAITGLIGTLIGLVAGFGVLAWITRSLLADTVPDFAIDPVLSAGTLVTAFLLGVIAVGLAPLFTANRLRHMDVPSALRVVE